MRMLHRKLFSSEFMRLFYKELKNGQGPAAALQAARRQMLSGIYAHPFYWAPFILMGDMDGLTVEKAEAEQGSWRERLRRLKQR